MIKKTKEDILEEMRRVVEGDSYNDPVTLYYSLKLWVSEVFFLLPERVKNKENSELLKEPLP